MPSAVRRNRPRRWKRMIDYTLLLHIERSEHAAIGINHRRNPGIGGANHGQALLDCTEPRTRQMLVRSARHPEPRIVGHIQQPLRPGARPGDGTWKDRLVANKRRERR